MTNGKDPRDSPAPTAPVGLRVIQVTSRWALGEIERCLVMIWSGQPDVAAMQRRADALLDLTRRAPRRCVLVEIVEATAKPPAQETRRVAMEVFKKLGPELSAVGFVVEGNDMRAALIRAVITGMRFFVKQPQPTKLFKGLPAMIEWVRSRVQSTDPNFDSHLAATFEHLRDLMHSDGAALAP